ncbi:MAG: TonB-dependent receptor, partial [Kofleriaceae bacterium]
MKNLLTAVIAFGVLVGAVAPIIELNDAHAQTGATVGSLRGTIRDKGSNNEPAVGATVVATSPALQGEQVVITEDGGQYFISSLPPGLYVLTVYYNDATFSRGNVLIQVGKEAVVNVTVDTGAAQGRPKGETIVIQGSAPIIDQGSTKTGTSYGDDYTRNIPTGRTFGATVGATAGSQGDFYGVSFSGATSLENTYVVEGINTTDTAFGEISANLPNEFLQETEVITGGYNAEYGRATGGIVNVVIKQGSNDFRGSIFGYYRPGSLVADPEPILREGAAIDGETKLESAYDMGGELGGPIIKDRLWFHVGFNPSITNRRTRRVVNQHVDRDGDMRPDIDPETGFPVLEEVEAARRSFAAQTKTYFFTAKINGAINQNNQFQLSFFGNPGSQVAPLAALVRTPEVTTLKTDEGAYDVAGKYSSKLNDGKTQIDVVGGFHRNFANQFPTSPQGDLPRVLYNYERSLYDFADIEGSAIDINPATGEGCNDNSPMDPYPGMINCPVSQYRSQGLGVLEERTNDRISLTASITQRVNKLAGTHVFMAGADTELSSYDSFKAMTGGQVLTRTCNEIDDGLGTCEESPMAANLPGLWVSQQYIRFNRFLTDDERMRLQDADPSNNPTFGPGQVVCAGGGSLCQRADSLQANTNNRSFAAYVRDSWSPLPNLTLNLGIRYEQQAGYVAKELQGKQTSSTEPGAIEVFPDKGYDLKHLWAPRVGFIYDPTKEGKAKLFGHWGRFYENIPMDLNVRLYGGEVSSQTVVNQSQLRDGEAGFDPNCAVNHGNPNLVGAVDQCADRGRPRILGEGLEITAPSMKGQYSDELIFGAEYEVASDLKVGMNYIHRSLPNVIEDVLLPDNSYMLVNPGKNFDEDAAAMEAQAAELMATSDPGQQALGRVIQTRAEMLRRVNNFDKPERLYDALQ